LCIVSKHEQALAAAKQDLVRCSLPPSLQELSDTASFKRNLKTLLFQRAFYL